VAFFKEIWTFAGGSGVWSEVYYSMDSSLSVAAAFKISLLNARLRLLHPLNQLKKIRVSDTANPRASAVVQLNKPGLDTNVDSGPAANSSAVVCTLSSTIFPSSRRLWLRGYTDDEAFRDRVTGNDRLSANFAADLKTWFQRLEDNDYCVNAQVRVGNAGVAYSKILSVNGTRGDGTSDVKINDNLPLLRGDTITLTLISKKDAPALSGRFTVLDYAFPLIKIQYTTPLNSLVSTQTGRVKKYVPAQTAKINARSCGFAFIGSRKAKNIATGSRGARSASRIRNLI